ncbi:MAG: recombinase family protein, partial [Bacilli bacterium]
MDLYKIREEFKKGKTVYDLDLRVAYYARVSTDKYEQLNSLENQVGYFEEMIREKKNWTFIEGYVDEGLSGTSTDKRDGFNKMIKDATNGRFDLLVTKEVSRFARDTLDSIKNTRKLLSNGVGVYFINDNINTLDPDSELRLTIMTSLAQDEVRKLSERVKFGYQRSIKSGRVLGNNDIWGYEKRDCKLIIVEEEAKMIKRLFKLYTTGKYGVSTVSKMLFNEGFKNKNGNPLSFTTIANIIRNPKYKGYYCGNKSTIVDYKLKTKIKKDKDDWVIYKDYDNVPPIISEEVWDLANNIYCHRSDKTKDTDRAVYQNRYNFSGKIVCNEHDRSFHRKVYEYKTKDNEVIWLCPHNNMTANDKCKSLILYEKELTKILRNALIDFINKKDSIIYILSNLYRENISLRDFDKEVNKLNIEIERIKREKDKLLNLSIDEIISDNEFKERNDNCNNKINNIEIEINNINEEQIRSNNKDGEISKLEALIEDKINKPTDVMLFDLLDKIVVYNSEDKISVKLKIYLKIGKELEADYINPKSQ